MADGTRRGILERVGRRPASITDLADAFGMTLTGMKMLEQRYDRPGEFLERTKGEGEEP